MKSFQSYQDFLIYLVKNPKSALIENCQIIEKFIDVKSCFEQEPHLFDAFLAQCSGPLNTEDKERFEGFVESYFLLKSQGFFEASVPKAETIVIEKPNHASYTSAMTDLDVGIELNLKNLYI